MYLVPPNENQLEFIKKDDSWQSADIVNEDVTHLIEWISKQPHLPNITDRAWLTHFMTGCKFNLQKSKQIVENYFVRRAEYPEFFETLTVEQLDEASKIFFVYLLPKLSPQGNRIFCSMVKSSDEENFDAFLFSRVFISILDLQMKEEPMYGNILLFDLKNLTLSQFMSFTPTLAKKIMTICLNAFPLRVKSVHYVNPPKFIARLIMFFKMFIPPKFRSRFVVHETLEDLHEHLPRDILPDVYGGTNGTLEDYADGMRQLYEVNRDWLAKWPKADLSRRPGKSTNTDEMDMNGTFRKLQID